VDNWNNITNSQNRVRKKCFGGAFCFSNCHIIRLDTGGLVFLVSVMTHITHAAVSLPVSSLIKN
jgi:ABC-type transporter Mla MlaB component